MIKRILIVLLLVTSGLAGFIFSLHHNQNNSVSSEQEIPNDVRVIQTFHYPATFVKQLEGDKEAGRKIFQEFCSACHANPPKIDIRAPRIGDKKTWNQLKKSGVPVLLKITIDGAGAMPARGGCFECSDSQLQETILYILKKSS